MEQKNKNIKITLLGGVGVGKTTLINMYLGQEFTDLGLITMGNDQIKTKIKINNNYYNLSIWDTGGAERLRLYSVNAAINSDIIIYVFDVSNLESFEELKLFIRLVQENNDKNYYSCIIGNKTDKLSENEFDDEIIKHLTSIKGIGIWTAKMYLLFVLNRQDILPVEDGAFTQSYRWLYKID